MTLEDLVDSVRPYTRAGLAGYVTRSPFKIENVEASSTGLWLVVGDTASEFTPSDEDLAATDWDVVDA